MTFLFIINKGSWAFDLCTVSLVSVSQTPEVSSEALVAVWSVDWRKAMARIMVRRRLLR